MTQQRSVIEIETKGFEELSKRARDPKLVNDGVKFVMFAARRKGKKTMVKRISGGTGLAERSIFASFSAKNRLLRIGTKIVGWRAESIEEGRRPGSWG